MLRGDDSTGMIHIDRFGDVDVDKHAGHAVEFLRDAAPRKTLGKAFSNGAALVGHNRKATRGVISDNNAHPFNVDDRIILVHNGTLFGDHKKIADVDVDSHAIAHLIHKHDDNVEAALKEVNGAYALIWYDVKEESLNFIRNSQRPLFFVETAGAWLWASEDSMLNWAMERNKIVANQKPEMLLPDNLFTFKLKSGGGWDLTQRKLDLSRPSVYSGSYVWPDDTSDAYESYIMGGSCDMRATRQRSHGRHPYSMDDDQYDPSRPVHQVETRQSAATVWHTNRESKTEEKLADTMAAFHTVADFSELKNEFPMGSWVLGEALDYCTVAADGTTRLGHYLFASIEGHPDVMLKIVVKPNVPDTALFDWTMNQRKLNFKISTSAWKKYAGQTDTHGYTMFYCSEYGEMIDAQANTATTELKLVD